MEVMTAASRSNFSDETVRRIKRIRVTLVHALALILLSAMEGVS